jgi:AcrR family transcriptional regulator
VNDTKTDIIRTAIALFSRHGFDRVSTRDIAKEVGIASPSLYKHFRSMDEITRQALAAVTDARASEYERVLSLKIEPRVKLKAVAIAMASGFQTNPALIHLYQQLLLPNTEPALEIAASLWDRDLYPRFLQLIRDADHRSNADLAYYLLFSFLLGAAMYMPTQNRRRPLLAREKNPVFLAERALMAALPCVDWKRVQSVDSSNGALEPVKRTKRAARTSRGRPS